MKRASALILLLGACVQAQSSDLVTDGEGVLPVLPISVFQYSQDGTDVQVEVEGTSMGGLAYVLVSGQPDEGLARAMAAQGCAEAGGVLIPEASGAFVAPAFYRFSEACQQ